VEWLKEYALSSSLSTAKKKKKQKRKEKLAKREILNVHQLKKK
jgi:hypothetical protein